MAAARYSFLPWLRRGAADAITTAATARTRVEVPLSAALSDGEATGAPIQHLFKLIGPGDIIGIDPEVVVRTEPRAGTSDFEPNYLAFIDFYDEDFCTRYTPAPPDEHHRLVPWLTLLVLADGEFACNYATGRPLNSVRITAQEPASFFPPDDQVWAWAHVQIAGEVPGGASPDPVELETRLTVSPDSAIARLLCPRRLAPDTVYTAFVVPTFEVGRKAGLSLAIDDESESGVALSWHGDPEFPVYYEWSFRTGARGDFEDLVQRMSPGPVDSRVGVRDMDIATPGFGMPVVPESSVATPDPPARVVGLEGALKAPTMTRRPEGPIDEVTKFPSDAAAIVNSPATAQADGLDDPIVAPPLVGGWHALVDRVDPEGVLRWIDELNLDPRYRAASGLGAAAVRANQERYKKLAWEQVGEVLVANRRVALLRFAQSAAHKSFVKHVLPLPKERALMLVGPAFARVRGSENTIRGLLHASRVPDALMSAAFRKITRPRGPAMRRVANGEGPRREAEFAAAANDRRASAAPPQPPVGGTTVERVAKAVDAGRSGAILRFPELTSRSVARRAPERFALSELPDPGEPHSPSRAPEPSPGVAAEFAEAQRNFAQLLAARPEAAPERPGLDIADVHGKMMTALAPSVAYPKRAAHLIRVGDVAVTDYTRDAYPEPPLPSDAPEVRTVFAYPDIKEPMYAPLKDLAEDLLVPNLSLVPANTISLLLTNQPFIEAYMAGANHEFMRELLWMEYPTDSRGSPLRQFWDVSSLPTPNVDPVARARALKDIKPLDQWKADAKLGENANPGRDVSGEGVVVVLRGDLLTRYPNTLIYAQRARWSSQALHADELALYDELGEAALAGVEDPNVVYPLFTARISPDVMLVGFKLGLEEVRGDPSLEETSEARASLPADKLGWFFVLQQAIGEPRFGLDERAPPVGMESDDMWANLAWQDVDMNGRMVIDLALPFVSQPRGAQPAGQPLNWEPGAGATSADLAAILNQKPVLVAWHARQMLERGKVG